MQFKTVLMKAQAKAAAFFKKSAAFFKSAPALLFASLILSNPAHAQAGLTKGRSVLAAIQAEATLWIPIIATIALMIIGILYATKSAEKETLGRWAVGIIVAGSAAQFTALLFT